MSVVQKVEKGDLAYQQAQRRYGCKAERPRPSSTTTMLEGEVLAVIKDLAKVLHHRL